MRTKSLRWRRLTRRLPRAATLNTTIRAATNSTFSTIIHSRTEHAFGMCQRPKRGDAKIEGLIQYTEISCRFSCVHHQPGLTGVCPQNSWPGYFTVRQDPTFPRVSLTFRGLLLERLQHVLLHARLAQSQSARTADGLNQKTFLSETPTFQMTI